MMTAARYIISLLLLAAYYLLLTTSPVRAEQPTNLSQLELNSYTNRVVVAVSSALICQITGFDVAKQSANGQPQSCNGEKIENGQVGGALGTVTGLISATFTPPASSGQYLEYLAGNFGIIKPAYAGEVGFKGLAPLLPIWAVFRNITYAFFVVAFVLVGFTIMLRVKIDPRTVMTIQNQIPKLVIALILVTFSYAIAGLLIDLMYVAIYLSVNIAGQVNPDILGEANKIAQSPHPIDLANIIGGLGGKGGGLGVLISNATGSIMDILKNSFPIQVGGWGTGNDFVANIFSTIFAGILSAFGFVLNSVVGIIAFLIIGIAVLFVLFRLWFELLKTYVFILIDVIFAPFWILVGVLPGGGLGFSSWLRDIIANLSVFPTTIIMFLLGRIFMDAFNKPGGFVPPLIGPGYVPEVLGSLIGLGIILMSLQVVTMVKEALKAPQMKYGAAIGQAIGVGTGVPITGVKTGIEARTKTPMPGQAPGKYAIFNRFFR